MIKRPKLQNSKKQNMYTSYSRKRIIKASRQQSSIYRNSLDWPVYHGKSITKQKLFGTQNWHQQDASASLDENVSVHTPRQPPPDIPVNPKEYKSDPEVSLNHDDLYARAWEYNYEQPVFDAENDKAASSNLQEIPLQSDFSTEEMRNTPEIAHDCSPEVFPYTDEVSDVADTCPHTEPDVESSSEQQEKSPTNPRSSKYNLRHNPKLNCNDDYRY